MAEVSFKTRVKNIAIEEAPNYTQTYMRYEYLVFASGFKKKYYIISGTKRNYLHLIGVHTTLDQEVFYEKCMIGDLDESDFDFVDEDGTDLKGTVRRKIIVLGNMNRLMNQDKLYAQEKFKKNRVFCTFGATDNVCTAGFMKTSKRQTGKAFPKTLMKGNELKKPKEVQLLLRRLSGREKFDEILIGNRELIKEYFDDLKGVISAKLFADARDSKFYSNLKVSEKTRTPICFRTNTYTENLKRMKLRK